MPKRLLLFVDTVPDDVASTATASPNGPPRLPRLPEGQPEHLIRERYLCRKYIVVCVFKTLRTMLQMTTFDYRTGITPTNSPSVSRRWDSHSIDQLDVAHALITGREIRRWTYQLPFPSLFIIVLTCNVPAIPAA